MLHDLSFLTQGAVYPPKSELKRIKTYRDNKALFEGEMSSVLAPYVRRIQIILGKFAGFSTFSSESLDRFELDLNYFQLSTLKLGDLVAGEPPTTTKGGKNIDVNKNGLNFNSKLLSIVYDVSRYGDSVIRLKKNKEGKNGFVVLQPSMWFPVVSREDPEDVLYHVLAWVEKLNEKKNILKVQIHEKGFYTPCAFDIGDVKTGASAKTFMFTNGLNATVDSFTLGKCVETGSPIKTGFDDFAVISFHNTITSDSIFGLNDYDRIVTIIAELQVRYSLESLILDKHTAPTMHAPAKGLNQTSEGWTLPLGGIIITEPGDEIPGYLTWDASLQANHTQIEKLEKHLFSLSEMGAIVNDESFGASQGFEALETRMTNARLKARRISTGLTTPIKRLIGLLMNFNPEELTVCWNDGLPNNEFRETDIATKKLQGGLFDLETLLIEHFYKSPEDAAKIAEKVRAAVNNSASAFEEEVIDEGEEVDGEKG